MKSKRVCIFGDSITWGAFLPFRVSWSNQLRDFLEKTNEDYVALYDLGVDGDTTRELLSRFDVEAEARQPNILIFAVGVNDSCYKQSTGKQDISEEEFESNLNELVRKARVFTDKIFFVGLAKGNDEHTNPLERSTTGKCYTKELVKKYDGIIKKVCDDNKVTFVDIYDKLDDDDFDDGLHPNMRGHVKIFDAIKMCCLD